MMTEEELQALAVQLSCPHGADATAVADDMATNNAAMIWQTILQLPVRAGDQILEIGHGGAAHLTRMNRELPAMTYHGLDMSEAMHKRALREHGETKNAHFYLYDGQNFPRFASLFDHIFSVNTLYFWPQPREFLQNLANLLAPNGQIVLAYGEKSFMKTLPFTKFGFSLYDQQDVDELAQAAGLSVRSHLAQQEQTVSRSGDPIERHYLISTLEKTPEVSA